MGKWRMKVYQVQRLSCWEISILCCLEFIAELQLWRTARRSKHNNLWELWGFSICNWEVGVNTSNMNIDWVQQLFKVCSVSSRRLCNSDAAATIAITSFRALVFTWIECCCFQCLVKLTVKERTVWSSQNIWLNKLADNKSFFNFVTPQPGAHQQSFLLHQITQILIPLIQIFWVLRISCVSIPCWMWWKQYFNHHIHSAVPHHSLSLPRLADACRLTQ